MLFVFAAFNPFGAYLRRWTRRFVLPALGLLALTVGAAAESLPKSSPFLPPAGASNSTQAGPMSYEFVGMTALGNQTLVGVVRQQDKRSFWIPVGKTANEITAVSYDPKNEEAVIRADGQTLTLKLRKGGVVPGIAAALPQPAAAPVAAPAAPPVAVPDRPLNAQEEKEMEARMLVTDLLEIGQQQRKAYEEAQRQAANRAKVGGNASPAATPPAPAPTARK